MGEFDTGVLGIVIHRVTPMRVRIIPAIGVRGMSGQIIMRMRLTMPPKIMMMLPVMRRISLEKKPTMRETRRSINM